MTFHLQEAQKAFDTAKAKLRKALRQEPNNQSKPTPLIKTKAMFTYISCL